MGDIFVSYSRQNDAFGRKLHGRLEGVKRDVWMDWEDIPFSSDWWQEIKRGIETSDNFLVILTRDFVTSPVCMLEVDYARANNKRILVIAHQYEEDEDTADILQQRTESSETVKQLLGDRDIVQIWRENWTTIGHVNWLFFNDEQEFEKNFYHLIDTLDTDLNHVRNHTNLQVRALEWFTNDKNWSFLLTGVQIDHAETWLYEADSQEKVPVPTHVQREFIKHSREQQEEQERNIEDMQTRAKRFRQASIVAGAIAAIMVVVAIGLTVFTGIQASNANATAIQANVIAQEAEERLTSIPPTLEAAQRDIDNSNTQVAIVGETLTPIGATLEVAENARQEAQALADDAQTQVVAANVALNDAESTLTPIAITLVYSVDEQATANALVATANVNSMTAQAELDNAGTQIAIANEQVGSANATLTPIVPTLTQASIDIQSANQVSTESAMQLNIGNTRIAEVSTEVEIGNVSVQNANATLTQIVPTLTQSSNLVAQANADIELANEQNESLQVTAEAIQAVADKNSLEAQSQSLIVNAEQATLNGDIDLALALILESYEINPNLPQTRRLLNDIGYTSARFILPNATFATFNPETTLIAYGIDDEVVIINMESREEVIRLTRHTDTIVAGEFNAEGNLFVTGSADQTVIVWDTETWEPINTLTDHIAPITDVAFDNRGARIGAVADNTMVIIWDVNNLIEPTIFEFPNPGTTLTDIVFFADGSRFLAYGIDGSDSVLYRVNIQTSEFARQIEPIYTTFNLAYDRMAGQVVRQAMTDTENFLAIYDLVQTDNIAEFRNGFQWVDGGDFAGARAFNSSGSQVVASISNEAEGENDIIIFDTNFRDREAGFEFEGEATQRVTALAMSPDGRTVLSGYGRYLVLWDVETGRELRRFGAHLDDIVEITYSLDSEHAITRSRDGNYRVWDVAYSDPAVIRQVTVASGSGAPATNPGLSPDNSLIIFNRSVDIFTLDAITGEQIRPTFSYFGLEDILYNPTNTTIITTSANTPTVDSEALLWDPADDEPQPRIWIDELGVEFDGTIEPTGIYSRDGRQMALSTSEGIRVYDITGGQFPEITDEFDNDGLAVGAMIFSPDGSQLYVATNQLDGEEAYAVIHWDLNTDQQRIMQVPHIRAITAIDINDNATEILTASRDQSVVLFDLEDETIILRMIGHQGSVNAVFFGQNDQVALTASDDGSLILWDLDTGQSIRQYVTGNPIEGLYLSDDDNFAVSTDGTEYVTLWQIETLGDVVSWVRENRAIPTLTAEQCQQYNVACETDE